MKTKSLTTPCLFLLFLLTLLCSSAFCKVERIATGRYITTNVNGDLMWLDGNQLYIKLRGKDTVFGKGYTGFLNDNSTVAFVTAYPAKQVYLYNGGEVNQIAAGVDLYLLGLNNRGQVLFSNNVNLFLWDPVLGEKQITNNTAGTSVMDASLGEYKVAYAKWVNTTPDVSDVFTYQISTGETRKVSSLPGKNKGPVINNHEGLYWLNEQSGQKDLICWEGGSTRPDGDGIFYGLQKENISPTGKIGLLVSQPYPDETVRVMIFSPASGWTEALKMDTCTYYSGPAWLDDSTLAWGDADGVYLLHPGGARRQIFPTRWSWGVSGTSRQVVWTSTGQPEDAKTYVYFYQPANPLPGILPLLLN